MNGFAAWAQLYANLATSRSDGLHRQARELVSLILGNHDGALQERAQRLHGIIGERVSVLPPDTRHVDYEVIPLMISEGCRYHCRFCCVQSARRFQARPRSDVREQIARLKEFYGRNLDNYRGLFLGNHDALGAGEELIVDAVAEACAAFGFGRPPKPTSHLFLFGSVHSLLKASRGLFERLNQLPFHTCINIGLESQDQATLAQIGKPLKSADVAEAFRMLLDINANYKNIEATCNFVIGKGLSTDHYESLKKLIADSGGISGVKGAIYLSPLKDSPKKRELLPLIKEMKEHSKMPVYVYLIQRL
jgi:radical SAM superfamily enzyme YgiQ (UPF0313 family)